MSAFYGIFVAMMAPEIKSAVPLRPYVVRVVFADGEVRDVDIAPLLDGPAFKPLRDQRMFDRVEVDELGDTIVWPNGADLDPDVIYGLYQPEASPAARITTPQRA